MPKVITINEEIYVVESQGSHRAVLVEESGEKFTLPIEDLDEAGITVIVKSYNKNGLVLTINGKDYTYTSEQYTPQELKKKFEGIAKHSQGKALAWVKKNATDYAKGRPGGRPIKEENLDEYLKEDDVDPKKYYIGL